MGDVDTHNIRHFTMKLVCILIQTRGGSFSFFFVFKKLYYVTFVTVGLGRVTTFLFLRTTVLVLLGSGSLIQLISTIDSTFAAKGTSATDLYVSANGDVII
jgi:hypothetical protein